MTPALLESLASTIAAMPVAGDAEPVALPPGVSREGDDPFVLRFDPPVDARAVVAAFGWSRAYACSDDAGWSVALPGAGSPRTGDWLVRAELDARPVGAPAPDLSLDAAKVTRLVLEAVEI